MGQRDETQPNSCMYRDVGNVVGWVAFSFKE